MFAQQVVTMMSIWSRKARWHSCRHAKWTRWSFTPGTRSEVIWIIQVLALSKRFLFHGRVARVVLDLDPANDVPFAKVKNIAEEIRAILDDCKLKSFVMLTGWSRVVSPVLMFPGSIGLHIMTPIKPGWDFDKVREFARAVVQLLEKKHPDLVTANPRLESRKGRGHLTVCHPITF